jgi:hypothetical protein
MSQMGVIKLQGRLLEIAEELGYQVILGHKWLGGSTGSCWDAQRRLEYFEQVKDKGVWGQCDFQARVIWISKTINQQHRVSVLIHELGHAILHGHEEFDDHQWEAEAEQVRRLVGEAVGIELPSNGEHWELLSRRRRKRALERGVQAGHHIISRL